MTITLDANSADSISSARLSGVKSAQEKQTAETAQTQQTQTPKTDRVELSEKAQQYLTGESTGQEQTSEAQLLSESADTSDSSTEISSSELYSYTDDQLSELLSKGEITQLQYNAEMAKRAE